MKDTKRMRLTTEEYFDLMLEDNDLEAVLEQYDITPTEALMKLFECGLINVEILEENYDYSTEDL